MPDDPPLSRLDLNLLVALDALLRERSVTRAAERLHLSQPALSASLARLRKHFDDPILTRRGNSYELTPLALRLIERTATALDATRRVFESQALWDPRQSTREFLVYGSDHAFATIAHRVSRLARTKAPGVRFRFQLHTPAVVEDAENRLRSADAMVLPHGFLTDLPFADLWRDRWVVLADENNTAVGESVTMDDVAELPWVLSYQSRSAFTSAGRQMRELGVEPRVEAVVESFLTLPYFVLGTDRLAIVQAGLAPVIRRIGGIRVLEPPFDATPVLNALWWHPVHTRDPEHEWMLGVFAEAAAELAGDQEGHG
ncbi:LysR family transcriptional regulator [Nocardiopsis sp. LOL_012]|uniref:LysR family transcriptional regulator n=1 Tax=Nocardiopsis sp. LOL_012 TaxID=3345409 RepID=UPI003A87EDDC